MKNTIRKSMQTQIAKTFNCSSGALPEQNNKNSKNHSKVVA